MTKEKDIEQLNSFLRGELSAIETYRQCIDKVDRRDVASQLGHLQASHQMRAEKLTAQIRDLGGEPATDSGIWGSFAKLVEGGSAMFGTRVAVAALEEGEDHGRDVYRGEIDKLSTSTRMFVSTHIMPEQERTHDALSKIEDRL